jgi:Transposase domain (DUF772)
VIGAVIIKHKQKLSDVETVQQIQENPYLQYFIGLPGYQQAEPFAASLFVLKSENAWARLFLRPSIGLLLTRMMEKGTNASQHQLMNRRLKAHRLNPR